VHSKVCRCTRRLTSLAQKAGVGEPEPALQKGPGGCADWEVVTIHGRCEYLNQPSRRLLNLLHDMPRIVDILGLEMSATPDFLPRVSARSNSKSQSGTSCCDCRRRCTTLARARRSTQPVWIAVKQANTTPNGWSTRSRSSIQPFSWIAKKYNTRYILRYGIIW
jgi:hypothetical protein